MKAYRTYITVTDARQVVLDDLPFQPGQRVEVLVLAQDLEREEAAERLAALLKQTQALPEVQDVTEAMIAEEIEAYRSGW